MGWRCGAVVVDCGELVVVGSVSSSRADINYYMADATYYTRAVNLVHKNVLRISRLTTTM